MRIVNLGDLQSFTAINLSSDPGAVGGPVVIPSCAQVGLQWVLEDGKIGHNVLYGRYSGSFAGTQAQCNSILAALNTGAQWTAMAAFMASTGSLAAVTLRDVNTANQAIIGSSGAGNPGTSASAALPNEVAAVGTLRTARAGRAFRGRIYVPNWATNALGAGNVIAGPVVTAYGNWLNTIAGALAASGYTWVLGQKARAAYTSPRTGVSYPARTANSVPITSAVCKDNHWDSQRRRGLK